MLVELAAANAAFAVIKEAVANAGDLMAAGQKVFDYFDAKSAIQRKANASGNSSDMEEFMALEQLKQQEEHLREMMVYAGRPGMWDDWLRFQAEAARKREAARLEELATAEERKEMLVNFSLYGLLVMLLGILLSIGVWLLHTVKGRG